MRGTHGRLRLEGENHPVSRNGRHLSFVRRGVLLAPVKEALIFIRASLKN
jgi:hypothetical protein